MNTAVINIKTDAELKKEAQQLASDLGISLTSVLNQSLKEFVAEKKKSFGKPKTPYGIFSGSDVTEEDIEEVKKSWNKAVDELVE